MEVCIYARISDDPTGKALGVERQVDECREYATQRGWDVREVFVDNDLSATSGKVRPAFEQLLSNDPGAILVWHTDRLVRLTRDLERVIALNVNVHALHAGHLDLSTPAGRAVARTVTAWATYEGEQKSERQRAAHRQRIATGKPWWPRRPFGLELDGHERADEADAIRRGYDLMLDGEPLAAVTREWNGRGLVRERSGKPWTPVMVRQILMNPRNAGIYAYRGEEVGPGAWAAIVTEDTYRAVVRVLSDPSRLKGGGGPRRNLLTGAIHCDKCGSTVKAASRGGRFAIYQCTGAQCISIRKDWTDWFVQAVYVGGLTDPQLRALLSPATVDVDAIKRELKLLRERLDVLAEDYATGLLTRTQLQSGTEKVRHLIAGKERELGTQSASLPEPDEFTTLSLDHRNKLIREALDVRVLGRGKGVATMSPDDFVIRPKAHPTQRIWMPLLAVPAEFASHTVMQRREARRV